MCMCIYCTWYMYMYERTSDLLPLSEPRTCCCATLSPASAVLEPFPTSPPLSPALPPTLSLLSPSPSHTVSILLRRSCVRCSVLVFGATGATFSSCLSCTVCGLVGGTCLSTCGPVWWFDDCLSECGPVGGFWSKFARSGCVLVCRPWDGLSTRPFLRSARSRLVRRPFATMTVPRSGWFRLVQRRHFCGSCSARRFVSNGRVFVQWGREGGGASVTLWIYEGGSKQQTCGHTCTCTCDYLQSRRRNPIHYMYMYMYTYKINIGYMYEYMYSTCTLYVQCTCMYTYMYIVN